MLENEILSQLNEEQQKAVVTTEGPLLILAGAGSGKTRVLVHRIAYLIDVIGVSPAQILAITFTNKAADEMRSRVDKIIGFGASQIRVSTFHSFCVRILRRYGDLLGYTRSFSIYDTDDQLRLMKKIFKEKQADPRTMREKAVLARISHAKDELVPPEKYAVLNPDYYGQKVAEMYKSYQKQLKENNAMDFDDLITKAVELFEQHPDVLAEVQDRYRYLMVDEYQDTNSAQFRFVSLIAGKYRNLCVVGDDDQSIYKFRGANIRNILGFEKVFPDAVVVKLERNYRSTKNILSAANEVISHNHGRKRKKLWTENPDGVKVRLRRFANGFEEAEFVCGEIAEEVRCGKRSLGDFAILYRTNAQSRLFEEKMLMASLPYRIVGGINFYARKEIKDVLAYLKTIDNAEDDLSVLRVINVPKRGIGDSTISKVSDYAASGGISFFAAVQEAQRIPGLSKGTLNKLSAFAKLMSDLSVQAEQGKISALVKAVMKESGYRDTLEAEETEEAMARIENLDELVSKAVQYEQKAAGEASLSGFLEEVSLIADIDNLPENEERVLLMTLHSAKGLEFPVVYMTGMEDGLFPGSMSINAENPQEEIEEERRLCYVGMTRAKELLTLTCAKERMLRGEVAASPVSRFVREIPRECIDLEGGTSPGRRPLPAAGGRDRALRAAISGGRGEEETLSFGKQFDPEKDVRYSRKSSYVNPYKKTVPPAADAAAGAPEYRVGDTVRHVKFGEGTVREITPRGNDFFVTVDFTAWGTKKMIASMARLQKV